MFTIHQHIIRGIDMAIIGWLACLIILGYLTFSYIVVNYASSLFGINNGWSGKVTNILVFSGIIYLWYLLLVNAPFTLIVQ
jgi:hypothetical protein